MKFSVTVLSLLGIAAFTKMQHINKHVPALLESLKQTHRRPTEITVDNGKVVETKWMLQRLDHFDKKNKRRWRMRYMVNEEHFAYGGPMFIFLGSEFSIVPGTIQSGILPDLAKEHKGILFYIEHRYYGESNPTSELTTENLQYLHSKQALADFAHFIRTQREIDPALAKSKVILGGCSYAGSLVIWFSKLYPKLMNGGWASSATILAQVDFKEYNEISGKAFRELGSQQCYNRIQNGIAELEAMFSDHRWAEAKQMMLLCDSFDHRNYLDLESLFYMIADAFTAPLLYQTGMDVLSTCSSLMSFEDDLTAVTSAFVDNTLDGQDCVDISYLTSLSVMLKLSPNSGNPRPWFYQLCNEFGWFQTTTSREQPFGTKVPASLLATMCYDVFGSKYTNEQIQKLVSETNKFFGGLKPGVRNIYVTHGALDPWRAMGQNETHGASVIPYASHCSDLNSNRGFDSHAMRASKQRLVNLVRSWLA